MVSILPFTIRRLRSFGRLRGLLRFVMMLVAFGALASGLGQVTTETEDLRGPVATVTVFRDYPDTIGRNLSETMSYRPDGTALERVYFSYSIRDGSLDSRNMTRYDDAGNPLAEVTMDPDGNPLVQTVYRYDDRGILLEEASYDAEGNETRRVAHELNADGNVAVREVYVVGVLESRTEIDYDAQGRMVEEREYEDGRLTEIETYTEPGRVSEFIAYDDEGQVESTGMVVRGQHGIEQRSGSDYGDDKWTDAWTYDENGLLLSQRSVASDGFEVVYERTYEFDEVGNWVRLVFTESVGGPPPEIFWIDDREITYH